MPEGDDDAAAWFPLVLDGLFAQQRLRRDYAKAYGDRPSRLSVLTPETYVDDAVIQSARRSLEDATISIDGLIARITFKSTGNESPLKTKPAAMPASDGPPPKLILRTFHGVTR